MIPKNIIRLSMLLSIMLGGILSSCVNERITNTPLPVKDDANVTFALNVPGSSVPGTRGLSEQDETNVETIDVLLFNNNESDERVYYGKVLGVSLINTPGDMKSFEAIIPVNECSNYDITIIANGRDQVISAGFVKGEPKSAALNKLVKTVPAGEKWNSDKIPMWGEALNVNVAAGTNITGENAVKMTRMISRIDVWLSDFAASGKNEAVPYEEKNANFKLASVRLYNYSTKGSLVPDLENGWGINSVSGLPEATAPNQPAGGYGKAIYGGTGVNEPLVYLAADQHASASHIPDSLVRAIYTLEAPAGSAATLNNNTCLVIGGNYQNGAETYYRIDFATMNQNLQQYEYINLLRNFRYTVTITKVSGEGFETPEEAFYSRPVNIEAEILEWNESYLSDVVFDGQNYLSATPSLFEFYRDAREEGKNYGDNILQVKTDYASDVAGTRSGWYVEKIVNAADRNETVDWLTLSPQNGGPKQREEPADKVKLIFGENREPEMRSAIVIIAAGRLRYEVLVKQSTIPDIMLNIVDPDTELPVKELIFTSPIGVDPDQQKFRVDWRPEYADLKVTNAAVISNPFPTGAGAPDSGTITGGNGGTGTFTYSIQPTGFTADQVSESVPGGDPFLEKSSKVDFVVSNGASYESKSIFLRQVHYNLLVDHDESYLIDGSTHSINVRSNAAWRIKSVTEIQSEYSKQNGHNNQILALLDSDNLREGTSGGYNITGEPVTFTVVDDRSFWGSIEVTFESADYPKKFEDKTVTLIFALPRVKLLGISTAVNRFSYNPGFSKTDHDANAMLRAAVNFGLDKTSTVYSRGFDLVGADVSTSMNDATLKGYLDQNPDIIVFGYNLYITTSQAIMYLDYMEKGGVILALCEGGSNGIRDFFRVVFDNSAITQDLINRSGAIYELYDVNDMVINGPFGDLRGLRWGEDASQTCSVIGVPESEIVIYSNGYNMANNNPSDTHKLTALRHKNINLVWFGDGGFLSSDDYNDNTICPFVLDGLKPVPKPTYGHAASNRLAVYNSQLFANMTTWAITQATINDN